MSSLLNAARAVAYDLDLQLRVRMALTSRGYSVADMDRLLSWLLSTPTIPEMIRAEDAPPALAALLDTHPGLGDEGASVADMVTVREDGNDLARVYDVRSDAIPDALIIAGIHAAYAGRATNGLPITRADEGSS